MKSLADEVIRQPLPFPLRVAAGFLVFLGFWIASLLLQQLISRLAARSDQRGRDLLRLVEKTVRVVLLILGLVCALGTAGVDVSTLVAGLGLTGFALGFALRDTLSNFLSGALIVIHRPFRRGDRIKVKDFEGVVVEVDLRYTTLQAEGKRFLIPNSVLFTEPVTVHTPKPAS